MFTIDLLKGAQKPPGSHLLQVTVVTIAFSALAIGIAFDAVRYFGYGRAMAGEQRATAYYEGQIAGLNTVAKTLEDAEQRRAQIHASLSEVDTLLTYHTKWTDILVSLGESAPRGITINDLMVKREERKDAQQRIRYDYSLVMGVVSPGGPTAVEQFVRALRLTLPLGPDSSGIRIVSQRQTQIRGRDFQYYVIECRLKP